MASRIDYSRAAQSAVRLLKKAGSERTLLRKIKSGDPARPTIVEQPYTCIGIELDATTEQIDGKTVLLGDKVAYVAPSLIETAQVGDCLLCKNGVKYTIYKVEELNPDGVLLLWTFWMRK